MDLEDVRLFKKMLQAVGVGGPSVETVLNAEMCRPGELISGEVRVGGAQAATEIQRVVVSLVAEVETGEEKRTLPLAELTVAEKLSLAAEEYHTIPFGLSLPWETPITAVFGEPLRGMRSGVSTHVAVAQAVDTSDLDPVRVEPLASQLPVIEAFLGMGARVKNADLEYGRIQGVAQQLPCYQEIEFFPPQQFAGRIGEIELTFVADPDGLEVVLEADRRGGTFTPGGDALGRIRRGHDEALHTDWTAEITRWLDAICQRDNQFGEHGSHGHGSIHGHRHHDHDDGRFGGIGGMLAAGAGGLAAGAVGGMIAGEMLDDDLGAEEFGEEMEEE